MTRSVWHSLWASLLIFAGASTRFTDAAGSAEIVCEKHTLLEQKLLDTASSSSGRYRFRGWVRDRVVSDEDLAGYGLQLEDDWEKADRTKPVVIVVHGFNSCSENNSAVVELLRAHGFPGGSYSYPNDHVILASAQRLSWDLRRFGELYPTRRIVLICHSMGGMVARACLEDPLYDPGNVDRLIMLAPPTHGTLLARFAVGTDIYEHWISRKKGAPWTRVRASIVDGLGEAGDDLCPDSKFLVELNSRPRNPGIRYSIFLGTGATMSEPQIEWIRDSVCGHLAKLPGGDGTAESLEAFLSDIDELVEGKGDGVVAVKRGRLEGVSDTLIMPFGHLAVTGKAGDEKLQAVHKEVLARLE